MGEMNKEKSCINKILSIRKNKPKISRTVTKVNLL